MEDNDDMNFDDRVDYFVLGGRPLKHYIQFVSANHILSQQQIERFKNQIKNIETETLKYQGPVYWPGVHRWVFRDN